MAEEPKLTGGKVNYYLADVPHPRRGGPPYRVECGDLIDALQLTFEEGTLLKALFRSANARLGNGKPDGLTVYDAEKMVYSATEVLRQRRLAST